MNVCECKSDNSNKISEHKVSRNLNIFKREKLI